MIVIDKNVCNEAFFLLGEGGWSFCHIQLNNYFKQSVRTPGPIPDLKEQKHTDVNKQKAFVCPTQFIKSIPFLSSKNSVLFVVSNVFLIFNTDTVYKKTHLFP